jgi:hypothetical protein
VGILSGLSEATTTDGSMGLLSAEQEPVMARSVPAQIDPYVVNARAVIG